MPSRLKDLFGAPTERTIYDTSAPAQPQAERAAAKNAANAATSSRPQAAAATQAPTVQEEQKPAQSYSMGSAPASGASAPARQPAPAGSVGTTNDMIAAYNQAQNTVAQGGLRSSGAQGVASSKTGASAGFAPMANVADRAVVSPVQTAAAGSNMDAVKMGQQQAGQNFKRRFQNFGAVLDANRQSAINFQNQKQGKLDDAIKGSGLEALGTKFSGDGATAANDASAAEVSRLAGTGGSESELLKQGASLQNSPYLAALAGNDAGQELGRKKFKNFSEVYDEAKGKNAGLRKQNEEELAAGEAESAKKKGELDAAGAKKAKDAEDEKAAARMIDGFDGKPGAYTEVSNYLQTYFNDDEKEAYNSMPYAVRLAIFEEMRKGNTFGDVASEGSSAAASYAANIVGRFKTDPYFKKALADQNVKGFTGGEVKRNSAQFSGTGTGGKTIVMPEDTAENRNQFNSDRTKK